MNMYEQDQQISTKKTMKIRIDKSIWGFSPHIPFFSLETPSIYEDDVKNLSLVPPSEGEKEVPQPFFILSAPFAWRRTETSDFSLVRVNFLRELWKHHERHEEKGRKYKVSRKSLNESFEREHQGITLIACIVNADFGYNANYIGRKNWMI